MPVYAFRCHSCDDSLFDETRPASGSDEPATCPTCGGLDTHRIYGFSSRSQIPKLMARVASEIRAPRPGPSLPGPDTVESHLTATVTDEGVDIAAADAPG
ncbi:MAG TPA: zinc ribbon domain-containing protein [Acidimicrobiales bacterium]|nr:zinc ribbon domain-containing protein [Acidimicrobiales bacterium]